MTFASDIKKWSKKVNRGYDEVVRSSLLQITSSIITKTPVDTGRARSNWFASIKSPDDGTTESTKVDFNKIDGAIVESVGDIFYFVNNLPYIKRLEFESHSLQAPAGMVRISIEEFQLNLNKAISQLGDRVMINRSQTACVSLFLGFSIFHRQRIS